MYLRRKMNDPICTPSKVHAGKKFPIVCDIALMCFCPMPNIFDSYPESQERYFLHLHPMHVKFCTVNNINFVVCAEVYGGPVAVSIVEELAHYNVSCIISIGFVGSLTSEYVIGTNLIVKNALGEFGTTVHYQDISLNKNIIGKIIKENRIGKNIKTRSLWTESNIQLKQILDLKRVDSWTTNAIYREYPNDVECVKDICQVVNMDTSHFYAACKKLNISCAYVCTVSDILDSDWTNHLTSAVNSQNSIVLQSQHELISSLLNNLSWITIESKSVLEKILVNIQYDVEEFFIDMKVCKSHDIQHILRCLNMLNLALEHEILSERTKFILRVAVLLHDVDDGKFLHTDNYDHAREIIRSYEVCSELEHEIIEVISYVSSSKNGDNIPDKAVDREYLLYPRFVDRLDASGVTGVIRCYQYTKTIGNPLYLPDTLKAENVWEVATEERYRNYKGKSISMIDHYYDKLLRLCNFTTNNLVLNKMKEDRLTPLLGVIEVFCSGQLTEQYMEDFVKQNS